MHKVNTAEITSLSTLDTYRDDWKLNIPIATW